MPLKHATETVLVFLLGLVLAAAGLTIALLPPVRQNVFPWAVAFAIAVAYPLVLYPLLRSRRADYAFRALHFAPALLLLIWLGLELTSTMLPFAGRAAAVYRFAWTLPAVGAVFLLMMLFCLQVLRQRRMRVLLLLLLFVPFAALGITAERSDWNPRIGAALRSPRPWEALRDIYVARISSSETSAQTSSEERVKMQLRRMDRRTKRLEAGEASSLVAEGVRDASAQPIGLPGTMPSSAATSAPIALIPKKRLPPLPSSGPMTDVALPIVAAGYCMVLHVRARKRQCA